MHSATFLECAKSATQFPKIIKAHEIDYILLLCMYIDLH
jgi:hypothetical protein